MGVSPKENARERTLKVSLILVSLRLLLWGLLRRAGSSRLEFCDGFEVLIVQLDADSAGN